jgi:hypothetical protein
MSSDPWFSGATKRRQEQSFRKRFCEGKFFQLAIGNSIDPFTAIKRPHGASLRRGDQRRFLAAT